MKKTVLSYATLGQQILAEHALSPAELASRSGCSRAAISKWRGGLQRPDVEGQRRLERVGVPAQAWTAPPTKRAEYPASPPGNISALNLPIVEAIPEGVLREERRTLGAVELAATIDREGIAAVAARTGAAACDLTAWATGTLPRAALVDDGPDNVPELAAVLQAVSVAGPEGMETVRRRIIDGPLVGDRLLCVCDAYASRAVDLLWGGLVVPGPELARRLEVTLGIPAAAWRTP